MNKRVLLMFLSLCFVGCAGDDDSEEPGTGTGTDSFSGEGFGFGFGETPDPNVELWRFKSEDFEDVNTPAISSDGTVYMGSDDKYLYSINAGGTMNWRFRSQGGYKISSSPSIGADGIVYFSDNGGTIYALNSDGSISWTYPTSTNSDVSDVAIAKNGTVLVNTESSGLIAFDNTGIPIWTTSSSMRTAAQRPIVDSSGNGTVYLGGDKLMAFELSTGELKWEYSTDNFISSSAAIGSDGTVYVGDFGGVFYAITSDGNEKWRFNVDSSGRTSSSPVIGEDGTIYVNSKVSGDVKLLAFSSDGNLKWSYDNGSSASIPVIGESGLIYIGGNVLTALNADGSVNWEVVTFRSDSGAPTISSNGTLYLPLMSTLFALNIGETGLANSSWPKQGQNIYNTSCVSDCTQ